MIRVYAKGYSNEALEELIRVIKQAIIMSDNAIIVRDLSRVIYYASTLLAGKDNNPDDTPEFVFRQNTDESNSTSTEE